jgi:hypothetical protein
MKVRAPGTGAGDRHSRRVGNRRRGVICLGVDVTASDYNYIIRCIFELCCTPSSSSDSFLYPGL